MATRAQKTCSKGAYIAGWVQVRYMYYIYCQVKPHSRVSGPNGYQNSKNMLQGCLYFWLGASQVHVLYLLPSETSFKSLQSKWILELVLQGCLYCWLCASQVHAIYLGNSFRKWLQVHFRCNMKFQIMYYV